MDAFLVAFKIPNFMRRLTAEGAFSQAFVPVISEYKVRKSHEEVARAGRERQRRVRLILFVITLIGVIAAPVLAYIFAPGFHSKGTHFDLTVEMLRFTFPYLFFISLVALGSGVLNSYNRFAVPALNQTLLNIVMIIAAGVVAPYFANPGSCSRSACSSRASCSSLRNSRRCMRSACCPGRASTARTRACAGSRS